MRPLVWVLQLWGVNLGNVVEGTHSIHVEERGLAFSWGARGEGASERGREGGREEGREEGRKGGGGGSE